jgi:hypothetical protein
VGEAAEHPHARGTERMADGDGAAVDVDAVEVEAPPLGDVGQALRGECLVELDRRDVSPADPRAPQCGVGRLDRRDAEHVGIDGMRRP